METHEQLKQEVAHRSLLLDDECYKISFTGTALTMGGQIISEIEIDDMEMRAAGQMLMGIKDRIYGIGALLGDEVAREEHRQAQIDAGKRECGKSLAPE